MGYSKKYSSLDVNTMDRWNMHTFKEKGVEKEKIKLCKLQNGEYRFRDIFEYSIKNTTINLEDMCPVLYDYLCYKKRQKGN